MTVKNADPVIKQDVATTVKEPPLFKVVFLNDNFTTMDFVISSLVEIFDYTVEDAHATTVEVHEEGSAVVAILPYELAEQKTAEVTLYAKANSYPLQAVIEPLS